MTLCWQQQFLGEAPDHAFFDGFPPFQDSVSCRHRPI